MLSSARQRPPVYPHPLADYDPPRWVMCDTMDVNGSGHGRVLCPCPDGHPDPESAASCEHIGKGRSLAAFLRHGVLSLESISIAVTEQMLERIAPDVLSRVRRDMRRRRKRP